MRKVITTLIITILLIGGGIYYVNKNPRTPDTSSDASKNADVAQVYEAVTEPVSTPHVDQILIPKPVEISVPELIQSETSIGRSVDGRPIVAHHFGDGDADILFIGGLHGGYAWNTSLVAYELIDFLKTHPEEIMDNERITVIPVLNPDGLYQVAGTADSFTKDHIKPEKVSALSPRFNTNYVDLNRNFDCDWKQNAQWGERIVSGGVAPFSEPESLALKNYIRTSKPDAVIVWYAGAGSVYGSSCNNGISALTRSLVERYAQASGYIPVPKYNFAAMSGDLVNWLAKEGVPAVSVLLPGRADSDWSRNEAGIKEIFKMFAVSKNG